MNEQHLIQNVPDLFNFTNFQRDGTGSLNDFRKLLEDTFKLKN